MDQVTPWRDDRGFSLVETLVAIVLLGSVVAALMTAMLTAVTSSRAQRDEVALDNMLKSAAESVLSRDTPYVDCATPTSYAAALPTDPAGQVVVTITDVRVWNGQNPPGYVPTCSSDPGAVRITFRATATSGDTQQLQVVKRRSGS